MFTISPTKVRTMTTPTKIRLMISSQRLPVLAGFAGAFTVTSSLILIPHKSGLIPQKIEYSSIMVLSQVYRMMQESTLIPICINRGFCSGECCWVDGGGSLPSSPESAHDVYSYL